MSAIAPSTLAECEAIIERGLTTFVEVGSALLRIRDERLYRESHGTFEGYCRERWNLSRPRAYQLIEAAEVGSELSTTVDVRPATERVARELAPLREQPDQMREAWQETLAQHGVLQLAEIRRALGQVKRVIEEAS